MADSSLLLAAALSCCCSCNVGVGVEQSKPLAPGAVLSVYTVAPDDAEDPLVMTIAGSRETLRLNPQPVITASDIALVEPYADLDGNPVLLATLTGAGSIKFGEATGKIIGSRLAIVVNGVLMSAPTVQDRITGHFIVSGKMTLEERDDVFDALTGSK